MKIKDAIDFINEKIQIDVSILTNEEVSITIEVLNMAISALEKQEGKRPIDRRCPNCGSDDIEVWQDGGYVTTKFNFCPNCGQKIDWTEVDDG